MQREVLAIIVSALLGSSLSCGEGDASSGGSEPATAVRADRLGAGLSLTDRHRLAAKGRFLVTPRWSPGGKRLLLSGWHGMGLHEVDLTTTRVRDLNVDFRGRATWSASGEVVRATPREQDGAWLVAEDGSTRIVYHPHDGALEAVSPHGTVVLAPGGAWDARVSRVGMLVAYCTGHLATARLHVVDARGNVRFEGSGAHPAWFPKRTGLVYAAPEPVTTVDGQIELGGSDLFAVGAPSWTPVRLTRTSDVTEMEPAISPAGGRVAFSDWETGTIFVARIASSGGVQ